MNAQRHGTDERLVRQYDYDDEWVVAADVGHGAQVDVVGSTAIVVDGDRQAEFDLPGRGSTVTLKNGVAVFRGKR